MKNKMKQVFSGILCLIMLMTTCCTAFAATPKTGTLNITGKAEAIGRTVSAYELFMIEAETVDGTTTYTYTLNGKYAGFFNGKIDNFNTMTDNQKSDAAYHYVLNLNTGANAAKNVQDFADAFITWINEQAGPLTADKNATMTEVKSTTTGQPSTSAATIADVPYGYYLVFVGNAPASLVNVVSDKNTVKVKSEYPTVDKKVESGESASSEIGQKVTYTLTSKVPDMDGYTSYVFNFKDTLSQGLTFNNDVKVTIDGIELTKGTDYTVTFNSASNSFVVEMKNMIARKNQTGKEIVVTYTATVNENAVTAGTANTNKATVEYSNDPSGDSKGESTPKVVEVYTFDIDLKKVAHGTNAPLSDATFELRAEDGATAIKLVKVSDNHYRVAKLNADGTSAEANGVEVVTSVTTDSTGIINIKGLKAGKYYLVETKQPHGYNLLDDPVEVVITATYNEDGTLKEWYVNKEADSHSGDNDVVIENRSGVTLPGTGAIGTAIFAFVGVGLIIGGTQIMGRRKKNDESEQ